MKKVHSTSDSIEANMIVDFLNSEGIMARIQKEHSLNEIGQPYEVWIDDPDKLDKAEEIITDIIQKQSNNESTQKHFSGKDFVYGLMAGIALMVLFNLGIPSSATRHGQEYTRDSNGDGKTDIWYEYSGSRISKEILDSDFNGTKDSWYKYSIHGTLESAEFDQNNDGEIDAWSIYMPKSGLISLFKQDKNYDSRPDLWQYYSNNQVIRYESDNDFDGRRDNWGFFENEVIKENMWSYSQDGIVNRKDLFRHGVLYKALFDLDSDGSFDEQAFYDDFERVIKREKLQ